MCNNIIDLSAWEWNIDNNGGICELIYVKLLCSRSLQLSPRLQWFSIWAMQTWEWLTRVRQSIRDLLAQGRIPYLRLWIRRPDPVNNDHFNFNCGRNRWRRPRDTFLHDIFRFFYKKCDRPLWIHYFLLLCSQISIFPQSKAPWEGCCSHRLRPCKYHASHGNDGKYDWGPCQHNSAKFNPANSINSSYDIIDCPGWA